MSNTTHYDVAVIGGGIAGCSIAYEAHKRGAKVMLLEKGALGDFQTNHALGFLSASSGEPFATTLGLDGINRWKQIPDELGQDIGLILKGNLTYPVTENGYQTLLRSREALSKLGLETEVAEPDAHGIDKVFPGLAQLKYPGAFYPHEGHVEPRLASEAYRNYFKKVGVDVLEGVEVQDLVASGNKIIKLTHNSGTITADKFVVAAGAWTRTMLARLHVKLPSMKIRGYALETQPVEELTDFAMLVGGWAIRQTPYKTLILSTISQSVHELSLDSLRLFNYFAVARGRNGIARVRVNGDLFRDVASWLSPRKKLAGTSVVASPRENRRIASSTLKQFESLIGREDEIQLKKSWGHIVDVMPDDLPVVGDVPDYPNLYVSTGYSGHGLTIAPYLSELLTEKMLEGKSGPTLDRLRLSRFKERNYEAPSYRF